MMRDAHSPRDPWRTLYAIGAIAGALGIAALLFDIGLAMVPGWGTDSVPSSVTGWFAQFESKPWLAIRNLDLLNVTVSLVTLPLYLAVAASLRREQPGIAFLGMTFVLIGTALFASANAALPLWGLSQQHMLATGAGERAAIEAAAIGLLARGAHGSAGAFGGFLISELGTLLVAGSMIGGRVFSRPTALLGVMGAVSLIAYSVLMTFGAVPQATAMALAAPGGILMIAWQVSLVRTLGRLGRAESPSREAESASHADLQPQPTREAC